MQKIEIYKTFTDKVFKSEQEAEKHEEMLKSFNIVEINFKPSMDDEEFSYNTLYFIVENSISSDKLENILTLLFGIKNNIFDGVENWSLKVTSVVDKTNFDYSDLRVMVVMDDDSDYQLLSNQLDIELIDDVVLGTLYKRHIKNSHKLAYDYI